MWDRSSKCISQEHGPENRFSEKIMLKPQPKALTANRRHRAEAATNGQGKP
jgi:hypothetical protein